MTTPRLLHTTGGPPLTARLLLTGYASAQPPPLTLTLLCEGLADPNGLVIGGGGVLYGTTNAGGGIGQAYSLTPPASPGAAWTYAQLYSFTGGSGGAGYGTVFALAPPASPGGSWTIAVLY